MAIIKIDGIHAHDSSYLNFVKMIFVILEIPVVDIRPDTKTFGTVVIEVEDNEGSFNLKLQDFGKVYVDVMYGAHEYQFEMLDMHTAKELAAKIKERIMI